MSALDQTMASLRIGGDDLIPSEITRLLGCEPTLSGVKGEPRKSKKGYLRANFKTGTWNLSAEIASPGNLEGQAMEILGKLTQDMQVWRRLASQYHLDLFCGLFMKESDEGLTLSPNILRELGNRGIELGLCLYGPLRGGDTPES